MSFRSKPDYQQHIPWKHPERPVLKAWTIKARNCDLRFMNSFFVFCIIILTGTCILLYYVGIQNKGMTKLRAFTYVSIAYIIVFPFLYAWTHSYKTCVYRCTEQGLELYTWNDMEKWKIIIVIIGIIMAVAILITTAFFPQAIMGLFIGPPVMAWFYFSLFTKKSYWEMQKSLTQKAIDWDELGIETLSVFHKRQIITIYLHLEQETLYKYGTNCFHIFCPKDQFEELVSFFKQKLPNATYKEGRVYIEMGCC